MSFDFAVYKVIYVVISTYLMFHMYILQHLTNGKDLGRYWGNSDRPDNVIMCIPKDAYLKIPTDNRFHVIHKAKYTTQ